MNNTTRAVIATAAIGALLIPLAGCGNTTTSSGKTELTVWSWDTSINRAAKSFMKANPDITVKVSNVGQTNETYTALNNAAQAGSGLPDVTLIEYLAIPQFVHSDTLMDLSKVYDTAKLKDTFTPGTWNSVNINGGLYAMPADSGPMAYFYDKDVFDKAGISEPPATWDEFYEDAKKIRATGSYITSDSGDGGLFNAMMWAMGGHAYKLNDDKLTINITKDKGAQRFMDLWQKMRDEDLIDVHTKSWTDDWMKSLGGGSIASLISGAWMANNLLQGVPQATGKFRVALLPTIDGTPINGEYGGSGLAIANPRWQTRRRQKVRRIRHHQRRRHRRPRIQRQLPRHHQDPQPEGLPHQDHAQEHRRQRQRVLRRTEIQRDLLPSRQGCHRQMGVPAL